MLCLIIVLGSICITHSIVIIASVFSEKSVIFSELLAELTLALSELTLTELELLALLTGRLTTAKDIIIIIIKLAYVGKRRLCIILFIILVHILLENLRKLFNFSACKNIVSKCSGSSLNLVKRYLLKLLCKAVILINVALETSLTSICILTKHLGCSKAFRVKLKNASLIFSALCKAIELFFLCLGVLILLFCLSELLVEVSYNLIIISDFLVEGRRTKACKRRERAESAKAGSLTNRHTKNLLIIVCVCILNVCVVISIHNSGSFVSFTSGDVVNNVF